MMRLDLAAPDYCARTCSSADAGSWTTWGAYLANESWRTSRSFVSVCYSRDHSWQRLTTSAPYLSSKARNEARFDRVNVGDHPPKCEALFRVQFFSSKTVHLCANPAFQITTDRDLVVVGQYEPSHTT